MSKPKPPTVLPHRVYKSGKRHMELIASVSRSSGLEKDGDALRDYKVQEEYRQFIQTKLDEFWKNYPLGFSITAERVKQREEKQQNLLILFRKLREGLLSTKRNDRFALEVYETSLYLSVIFGAPAQTTSILSHLLPHIYVSLSPSLPSSRTTLLSLLHHLVTAYPSQTPFHEQLHSIPDKFLSQDAEAIGWLKELARCLRTRNFSRLEQLTTATHLEAYASKSYTKNITDMSEQRNLPLQALCVLVNAIRKKAGETTWLVIRSAYREITCPAETSGNALSTSNWLCRSLALRSVARDDDADHKLVERWLDAKCATGEVRSKEGTDGCWILSRIKT